jgi:hypothetical protein
MAVQTVVITHVMPVIILMKNGMNSMTAIAAK